MHCMSRAHHCVIVRLEVYPIFFVNLHAAFTGIMVCMPGRIYNIMICMPGRIYRYHDLHAG